MTEELKPGTLCHYSPNHGQKQNGKVKSIGENYAFVVFHCNNEWDKYEDYTGQRVDLDSLRYGWVDKKGDLKPEYCDHRYIATNAKWQSATQRQCCFCGHTID